MQAAHRASSLDPELPSRYPDFDVALKAARFYYKWMLNGCKIGEKPTTIPSTWTTIV